MSAAGELCYLFDEENKGNAFTFRGTLPRTSAPDTRACHTTWGVADSRIRFKHIPTSGIQYFFGLFSLAEFSPMLYTKLSTAQRWGHETAVLDMK